MIVQRLKQLSGGVSQESQPPRKTELHDDPPYNNRAQATAVRINMEHSHEANVAGTRQG